MGNHKKVSKQTRSSESLYVLKLILLIFLGSLWLRVIKVDALVGVPLPVGFLLALVLIHQDHFQIDRKIEYALVTATMFVAYFLPFGIVIDI